MRSQGCIIYALMVAAMWNLHNYHIILDILITSSFPDRSLQGNRLTGKIPEVIGLMQALAVL